MSSNPISNRSLPLAEWPAQDREGWVRALQPGDPFEPGGVAASWAETTKEVTVNGYGRWLTWLDHHGVLDRDAMPAARVTKERVIAYMEYLQACLSPHSVHGRVQQLGDALRAIAPDGDWRWIGRGAARLRAAATPVKDKLSRLQSPDRLVDLGHHLMLEADTKLEGLPGAIQYRDGLLIAFLAYRPVRVRNLRSIARGKHLRCEHGTWNVTFDETKNHRRLDFPFPAELVPALGRYLEVYRPLLLTAGGRKPASTTAALWISQTGSHLGAPAIRYWVRRRTKAAFGKALCPHLFRDCAATFIATYAPEHVSMITAILGHTTIEIAQRHYNQARTIDAGRRYHGTIQYYRSRAQKALPHEKRETRL